MENGIEDKKLYEELEREGRSLKRIANGILVAGFLISCFVVWRAWPQDTSMSADQIDGLRILVMILTPVIVLWPTIGFRSAAESLIVTFGILYFIDPSVRASFLPDWWGYVMGVSMVCSAFTIAKLIRKRFNQF